MLAQKFAAQLISSVLGLALGTTGFGGQTYYPAQGSGGTYYTNAKPYAAGGPVRMGSGARDDVPAFLKRGEYVLNNQAVRSAGEPFLNALNSGHVRGFANGGSVRETGQMMRRSWSGTNSSVTVNYYGGEKTGEATSGDANAMTRDIEAAVLAVITKHQRAGGALYDSRRRS